MFKRLNMGKILFALVLIGCGGSASYGAPYMALQAPEHRRGVQVEGRDCTAASGFGNANDISAVTALQHALDGSGSTALVDVEISMVTVGFESCVVVRGTTVR
jgi:hypothetical protein